MIQFVDVGQHKFRRGVYEKELLNLVDLFLFSDVDLDIKEEMYKNVLSTLLTESSCSPGSLGVKSEFLAHALMTYSEQGNERMVEWLLKNNAPVDYYLNTFHHNKKRTPLHLASDKGHANIVALLLKAGADMERMCNNQNAMDLARDDKVRLQFALYQAGAPHNRQEEGGGGTDEIDSCAAKDQ